MLRVAYGDDTMKTTLPKRHKRFKEGLEDVKTMEVLGVVELMERAKIWKKLVRSDTLL